MEQLKINDGRVSDILHYEYFSQLRGFEIFKSHNARNSDREFILQESKFKCLVHLIY